MAEQQCEEAINYANNNLRGQIYTYREKQILPNGSYTETLSHALLNC